MSINYKALGHRVKQIRQQNQLSQARFSELIDKTPSYVSYMETGNRSMSLDTFVQIANVLEAPTDILLAEQLRGASVSASIELTLLLADCSETERLIILHTVESLKEALMEYRRQPIRSSR
jgi:transcriptional regulator with XRE-family HTH domain